MTVSISNYLTPGEPYPTRRRPPARPAVGSAPRRSPRVDGTGGEDLAAARAQVVDLMEGAACHVQRGGERRAEGRNPPSGGGGHLWRVDLVKNLKITSIHHLVDESTDGGLVLLVHQHLLMP